MKRDPDKPHSSKGEAPKRGHHPLAGLRGKVTADTSIPAPASAREAAPARHPIAARVTVRRERSGRGGKTVTLAEGPGLAGRDLAGLARDAARTLGVGARVERGALVVQGDQAERLAEWLSARGFASVARGN